MTEQDSISQEPQMPAEPASGSQPQEERDAQPTPPRRGFFAFGRFSVGGLCRLVFWAAMLLNGLSAVALGQLIYLTTTYERTITYPDALNPDMLWHSSEIAANLPGAIVGGLLVFVVGVFVWRLVCEVLFIVLRYFRNNTRAVEDAPVQPQ